MMNQIDFSSSANFESEWSRYGDTIIWKDYPWLQRQVRCLFTFQDTRLIAILNQFQQVLRENEATNARDTQELQYIFKKLSSVMQQHIHVPEPLHMKVLRKFQQFLHQLGLRCMTIVPPRNALAKALSNSHLLFLALAYRKNRLKKSDPADQVQQKLQQKLEELALAWKKGNKIYTEEQKAALTPLDKRTIKHICRYRDFADVLKYNEAACKQAFKFLIGHGVRVSLYVRYPASINHLYRAHVTSRVGGFHSYQGLRNTRKMRRLRDLKGQGLGLKIKDIGYVNVLGNHPRLLEALHEFRNKNIRPGKWEMFWDGAHEWDPHHWSVPMDSPDWYYQLPVFEKITFAELQRMFPKHTLEEGDSVWTYETTRQTTGRFVDGSHGYSVLYEPDEKGLYRVWPFGVFAEVWPETTSEQLKFLGDTVKAVVAYPDPNYAFYPHRQKARAPKIIKANDKAMMQDLRNKFKKLVLDPTLTFQWGGVNCAPPPEELILGTPGDLVKTPLDQVEVPVHLAPVIKPYAIAPNFLKPAVLWLIVATIGGTRKTFGKSLMTSPLMDKGEMFYPGRLHERILDGEIPGTVHAGHNRDHEHASE